MQITFQGESGAFSEIAARNAFPKARLQGLPRVRDVVESLASGEADRIVLPIETSGVGGVPEVVKELVRIVEAGRGTIVAERWEPIEPVLLGAPDTTLDQVEWIISHAQALLEAGDQIAQHLPRAKPMPWDDTAGAARHIASSDATSSAALASRQAGDLYGLVDLAADFLKGFGWHTRFLVIAPSGTKVDRANRTTLLLTPSAQAPNALFRSLTAFVGRRLALYGLEQLPRPGHPGQYRYLVDVEGDAQQDLLAAAISDARSFCERILVAGSYASSPPG